MANKILKHILIALIGAVIGILTAAVFMRGFYLNYMLPNALYGMLMGYPLWVGNGWLSNYTAWKFPWNKRPAITLTVSILYSSLFTIFIILSINWAFFSFIAKKTLPLLLIIDKAFFQMLSVFIITIMISFFLYARSFFLEWRNAAVAQEALKRQAAVAQFEMLKNQVNPHFLFNSLNVLTGLVETNPAHAVKFIRKLSDVYRYILENRDQDSVGIEKELEFIQSYIFLMQIRFQDALSVQIEPGLSGFGVVPVALQMLIENAIKHNVVSQTQPLWIRIFRQEEWLVIENNAQPRQSSESSGIGLANIRERYAWLGAPLPQIEKSLSVFQVKLPMIAPGESVLSGIQENVPSHKETN